MRQRLPSSASSPRCTRSLSSQSIAATAAPVDEQQADAIASAHKYCKARALQTEPHFANSMRAGAIESSVDWVAIVFCFLGIVSRFIWLSWPPQIVFDEYHFGKFVSGYVTGEYIFDIHPPLAKMMLALCAWLGGYDGSQPFKSVGEPFLPGVPIFALRALPAAFGAAIVPLSWLLALQLGCSRTSAALAASMVLLDGSLLVESRILVTDGLLFFFELAQLLFALRARSSPPGSLAFFGNLAATGLFIGVQYISPLAAHLFFRALLFRRLRNLDQVDCNGDYGDRGDGVALCYRPICVDGA